MQRVFRHMSKGAYSNEAIVGSVTLDRASRFKRRIALQTDGGANFLLDLPEATYLADGDGLALEDDKVIVVRAASEDLFEVHAHDATALARIAWHIGNRHTPCEITASALYIQRDHVLAEMIAGLGGHVHAVMRPFEPEGGAYGGRGSLLASHHHGDGVLHSRGHSHDSYHDHRHSSAGHTQAHGQADGRAGVGPSRTKVWRPD